MKIERLSARDRIIWDVWTNTEHYNRHAMALFTVYSRKNHLLSVAFSFLLQLNTFADIALRYTVNKIRPKFLIRLYWRSIYFFLRLITNYARSDVVFSGIQVDRDVINYVWSWFLHMLLNHHIQKNAPKVLFMIHLCLSIDSANNDVVKKQYPLRLFWKKTW